jgi:hypothetical protein
LRLRKAEGGQATTPLTSAWRRSAQGFNAGLFGEGNDGKPHVTDIYMLRTNAFIQTNGLMRLPI